MPRKARGSKAKVPVRAVRPKISRAAKVDRWGVDFLSTNPNSPLVSTDLIKILSQPETWAQFSKEELEELGTQFPEDVPRNEDGSISIDWLRYNNDWRNAVRLWQADLGAGHFEPEWLRQAAQAMEDRTAGKFDNFKEEQFEEFWGQKQKVGYKTRAGESGVLKLPDLIAGNLFKEDDFWVYSRGFGATGKSGHVEIIKDCKIVEIGEKTLTFAIPPGQLRYARKVSQDLSGNDVDSGEGASASTEEDVVLFTAKSVRALELKILNIDGRFSNPSHRNPWMHIRCQRNNQDIGSLFDMREEYYFRTHPS